MKYYTEEDMLKEYGSLDKVDWEWVGRRKVLSEVFIDKYADKLDWNKIGHEQTLSEALIEKHIDKVYWTSISHSQKLSEAFIDKYKDKVDWYWISHYQVLSNNFIIKHFDKIKWKFLHLNGCINEFTKNIADKIYNKNIAKKQAIKLLKSDYAQIMDKL